MNDIPLPQRLQEIVEDFEISEGREKLELLLEFSERMPPLPEWLQGNRDKMEEVPECMTPVHIQAEVTDNHMAYYFDIPKESPTVRGFAAVLAEGLNGLTAQEILRVPADFHQRMALERVLTHQRLNGISAILAHMKRLAAGAITENLD